MKSYSSQHRQIKNLQKRSKVNATTRITFWPKTTQQRTFLRMAILIFPLKFFPSTTSTSTVPWMCQFFHFYFSLRSLFYILFNLRIFQRFLPKNGCGIYPPLPWTFGQQLTLSFGLGCVNSSYSVFLEPPTFRFIYFASIPTCSS